jgi:hypothetical protein
LREKPCLDLFGNIEFLCRAVFRFPLLRHHAPIESSLAAPEYRDLLQRDRLVSFVLEGKPELRTVDIEQGAARIRVGECRGSFVLSRPVGSGIRHCPAGLQDQARISQRCYRSRTNVT